MPYQIFDNSKPADYRFHNVSDAWHKSYFETWRDAHDFALNWLGPLGEGVGLMVDTPYDYSGHGDYLEIRYVESDMYANVVTVKQVKPDEWLEWLLDKPAAA